MAALRSMSVSDLPEVWSDLGFGLRGDRCTIDGISIRLGAPGRGVAGWAISGVDLAELPADAFGAEQCGDAGAEDGHPNGVVAVDHVVVSTPDLDRTVAAFEHAGLPLRRTRQTGKAGPSMTQAFFRLDNTVVEVVGPPVASGTGPASIYGLAFTVSNLAATASHLGERLRPSRDAVQPGRRIATLERSAGSAVPMAFISPR